LKNRFNRRHRLPLGEDETSILAGARALRAGRGQRSASLHIVIPVIVAPRMSLMRGVSPTLVRIEHRQRYAHSDSANDNCGVATSGAPHVFISFDHFPR
jgi:hypothetical protein